MSVNYGHNVESEHFDLRPSMTSNIRDRSISSSLHENIQHGNSPPIATLQRYS